MPLNLLVSLNVRQGVCKLYERSGKWAQYVETLRSMMDLYTKKCENNCIPPIACC